MDTAFAENLKMLHGRHNNPAFIAHFHEEDDNQAARELRYRISQSWKDLAPTLVMSRI